MSSRSESWSDSGGSELAFVVVAAGRRRAVDDAGDAGGLEGAEVARGGVGAERNPRRHVGDDRIIHRDQLLRALLVRRRRRLRAATARARRRRARPRAAAARRRRRRPRAAAVGDADGRPAGGPTGAATEPRPCRVRGEAAAAAAQSVGGHDAREGRAAEAAARRALARGGESTPRRGAADVAPRRRLAGARRARDGGDDAADPRRSTGPTAASRAAVRVWLKSGRPSTGSTRAANGVASARRSAHSGSGGLTLTRLCVRRETSGAAPCEEEAARSRRRVRRRRPQHAPRVLQPDDVAADSKTPADAPDRPSCRAARAASRREGRLRFWCAAFAACGPCALHGHRRGRGEGNHRHLVLAVRRRRDSGRHRGTHDSEAATA